MSGPLLLDVNVLVAFLWPRHGHHALVRRWFAGARSQGWASCPFTQLGTVRVLANPVVSEGGLNLAQAAGLLAEFIADSPHQFWPAALELGDVSGLIPYTRGHNQLTDRYLLALAAAHGGVLATLDRSMLAGLPAGSPQLDHIEVVAG